jgi:hypothetical protein
MKIEITSINQLDDLLKEHSVDTTIWGTGKTRTLVDLFLEIAAGETVLTIEEGRLTRTLHVVGINVTCGEYRLKEDRQELTDGRVRHRELSVSCAEKIIGGEDPKAAAVRCLKEELQIDVHPSELIAKVSHTTDNLSNSYPGLYTIYYRNPFEYEMKPELFKEEGYQEFQDNKTTFFVWTKNAI